MRRPVLNSVIDMLIGFVAGCSLLLVLTAGGCDESKGSCHPGDTKAAHGHVQKCGTDGKWHL